MGWWNSDPDGASLVLEDTGNYWGDGPADVMDAALEDIKKQFQETWARPPKLSELIAGVKFAASGFGFE